MHSVAKLRKKVWEVRLRKSRKRGFTLIEMLVVIAIITIFAAIAFVSIGQNKFDSVLARYTADVRGMVIRARTTATLNQTQVWLELSETNGEVLTQLWWLDPVLASATYGTAVLLEDLALSEFDRNYVGDNDAKFGESPACIYPVEVGIRPPSQAVAVARGSDCLNDLTRIVFLPSGELSLEVTGAQVPLFGAGVMIPVVDQRLDDARTATLIEIYPGGLVRAVGGVQYDQ